MIQLVREGALGDAALVVAALAGDSGAFASLFDAWFDRCFDVAYRIVRNRDVAAEVAQEVFLAAWRDLAALRDHTAFGGWVLRASRNRALNRLEKERRSVALGDEATARAVDAAAAAPDAAADVLSGTGAELLWAATAALGERDASVLDLHLRHGLAAPELAEALGVTANNAHQLLFRLKAKLGDAIRSFVLWHDGRPSCPELQDVLHRAGLAAFGPDAAKIAQRHAETCERCGERQRSALAPEVLFAGVPLVLAGPELRAKVISALGEEGLALGPEVLRTPAPPPEAGTTSDTEIDRQGSAVRRSDGGAVLPPASAAANEGLVRGRSRRRRRIAALVAILLLLAGAAAMSSRADDRRTLGDVPVAAGLDAGSTISSEVGPSPTSPVVTEPGTTEPTPTATTLAPLSTITPTTGSTITTITTSTTRSVTTSAPPLRPPVVQRFAAAAQATSRACPNGRPVQLTWTTTGATAVALAGPGAPAGVQAPSGTLAACAPSSTTAPSYLLSATGPGGTTQAQATI